MSVFASLAQEHALLLRVIARLERGAADPDPRTADRETREALSVLLNGLEQHERLEHLVFDEAPEMSTAAGAQARELITQQHGALDRLRAQARELLARPAEGDGVALRGASTRLARMLRRHFLAEERQLWPRFNACAGRSTLSRLSRTAREQLRVMTRELERFWFSVGA